MFYHAVMNENIHLILIFFALLLWEQKYLLCKLVLPPYKNTGRGGGGGRGGHFFSNAKGAGSQNVLG